MTSLSDEQLLDALETIYQHMCDDEHDIAATLLSALLDELDPTDQRATECTCGSTDGFHADACPAGDV